MFEDVEVAEPNFACVGLLKSSDGAHEGGLPGAVRAEESVHAGRDREADVLEGLDAVAVGLGDVADLELHGAADRVSQEGDYVATTLRVETARGFTDSRAMLPEE